MGEYCGWEVCGVSIVGGWGVGRDVGSIVGG